MGGAQRAACGVLTAVPRTLPLGLREMEAREGSGYKRDVIDPLRWGAACVGARQTVSTQAGCNGSQGCGFPVHFNLGVT